MTATVYVRLKREVLDPQGSAVARALATMGIEGVRDVRIGKLVELELAADGADDPQALERQLGRIADELLANPVIEDYEIVLDRR
ncbi:MAG: phosphoribosylformylglycinamidine synthase subunit PurS [Deltaproteobacteria bacterium]|nr:phosphoribosylformylglycinamidine synthase subunit PurS [Deltaproteobacteria bacterium]MBW2530403.1 phosphoribosylformylglycinamidine synthase subunit PurS [Deltaproteobacteria bacterium]